jgi:hypothetical protein
LCLLNPYQSFLLAQANDSIVGLAGPPLYSIVGSVQVRVATRNVPVLGLGVLIIAGCVTPLLGPLFSG